MAFQTSDDEFGYDFETDDEELLIQLASKHSPPLKQSTDLVALAPAAITAKKTISSSKTSREDKTSEKYVYLQDATSSNGFVTKVEASISTSTSTTDQKQTLSSTSPVCEIVAYPDREYELDTPHPRLDKHLIFHLVTNALQAIAPIQSPPPTEISNNDDEAEFEDDHSPLKTFRSYPRRPLTVSDLAAGAWCELQYWYTLTRLPGGRRTRTPAMKQGSKVHKKLEDEVHTTVKIEILNREDGFGLRLWNLVQGLRTLRDTGLTRELEVWGMVDGNLVNGVIDDLSYDNPNPEFERELSSECQPMVSDYFPPLKPGKSNGDERQIFLSDVKTRGTVKPISAAAIRPAKIQLLLYHRFLSDMAADKLDFFKVFRRYGLDPDERFSDTFMSQIGELHDEIFFDDPSGSAEEYAELKRSAAKGKAATQNDKNPVISEPSSPGVPDFLKYGTLRELVALVKDEIRITFPRGADSVGSILRVQYVFREDGRELTTHDFPVSPQALDSYLAGDMSWWRGERRPAGVTIEEAFKCLSCEFAMDCEWRRNMDQERVKKTQERVNQAKKVVETRF